jgi:hypothetical protein
MHISQKASKDKLEGKNMQRQQQKEEHNAMACTSSTQP